MRKPNSTSLSPFYLKHSDVVHGDGQDIVVALNTDSDTSGSRSFTD
ncbi:MAG: hypothetical protein QXD66_04120 [Candidatus Nezhaarchaeales archaeon]